MIHDNYYNAVHFKTWHFFFFLIMNNVVVSTNKVNHIFQY